MSVQAARVTTPPVLLVEDDRDSCAMLAFALKRGGFEVATAPDGLDALEWFREHRTDALVTDVFMPRMDGIMLIQAIRELSRDVPLVAISAGWNVANLQVNEELVEKDVLVAARRAGADRTFSKPVDPLALVSAVRSLL